jgi:atypical dual specificity phosphatase
MDKEKYIVSENVLDLRGYGVAFGEKIILRSVNLQVPDRDVTVLIGPAGTGKSTLLRTITGLNDANPSLRTWGNALYVGEPLGQGDTPVLVAQNTKLMLANVLENVLHDLPERRSLSKLQQLDVGKRLLVHSGLAELVNDLEKSVVDLPLHLQRHLAIARSVAANPRVLCLDEPTTGLEEQHCQKLIHYITDEAKRRAILVVVHNQNHARSLGGNIALLAGGWIHEVARTEEFLKDPTSEAGKAFVRTGSCDVPSPNADPDELSEEALSKYAPPPLDDMATNYISDAFGPRNFLWLKKGMLAGTPRPGLLTEMEYDMKALKRVGVTVLINLTRTPFDEEVLREYDIKGIFFPIADMEAPDIEDAKKLCYRISRLVHKGEAVAIHCKAGLGRTGTMLAASLIWEGQSALEALENVRKVEPRWVQSDEQVAFLEQFAETVRRDHGPPQNAAVGM